MPPISLERTWRQDSTTSPRPEPGRLLTVPSPYQRRGVLYVGQNYALLAALQDRLADLKCHVVRCPAHGVPEARLFIESEIPYAALLFDEVLVGATGAELERFALSLPHRAGTPTLIVRESDGAAAVAERVRRLLKRAAGTAGDAA